MVVQHDITQATASNMVAFDPSTVSSAPLGLLQRYVQGVVNEHEIFSQPSSSPISHDYKLVAKLGLHPFVAANIIEKYHGAVLVTANSRSAHMLQMALQQALGVSSYYFPAWETFPCERLSPGVESVGTRRRVLAQVVQRKSDSATSLEPLVIITTIRALMQPIISDMEHNEYIATVGHEYDFQDFKNECVALGYEVVDIVSRPGEMAVRGGIIDIFPSTGMHPVRIDFFGDEITELRYFSPVDQRSFIGENISTLEIFPAKELYMGEKNRQKIQELIPQLSTNMRSMAEKFAQGIYVPGAEILASPLNDYHPFPLLLDAISYSLPLVMFDQLRIAKQAENLFTTSEEFHAAAWSAVSTSTGQTAVPVAMEESIALLTLDQVIEHNRSLARDFFTIDELDDSHSSLVFSSQLPPMPQGDMAKLHDFTQQCKVLLRQKESAVIVVVSSLIAAERVIALLKEYDLAAQIVDVAEYGIHTVQVVCSYVPAGCGIDDPPMIVITDTELTGVMPTEKESHAPKRKTSISRKRIDPLDLAKGDLVVHEHHGVGKFIELAQRTVSGVVREYVVLEFAPSKRGGASDRLYVPMDALDALSRYVGGSAPALSKLGGSDWQKTKRAARKAVRDIAAQLVKLYAARQKTPGYAFSPDTPWQRELEDSFPYIETPDQLMAIEDTKADMEKPIPMDRVIIGDVGYGKTEVAIRAAFKAVQDGKQVAVLVPTTLLADQHLATFTERMRGFPVIIKALSRFTSPKDSKQVIAEMASGKVDIVIGTHRLLQTGVIWKDLGLVIVDEEQRFGVEHKEHITALHNKIDVLTLSATPIPRTLEMSLSGIREMSPISTPPMDRHPILTYVGGYDDKYIQAAISRELLRDGQVFYIHNKVATIDKTAAHIRSLVPDARVAVAHGQMSEELLEKTVEDFWNRQFDVLVCTTIVETGLDISNANTLIVEKSENLGLSQLHQLRGRVGRSKQRGYAYFLYSADKALSETAYDRLATIANHTDLGAGMAVAMKDLEIRGAGNILGAEQSGHIAGVGFDLYLRLVSEAVEAYRAVSEGRGIPPQEKLEIRLDIPVDASIPSEYISSERLRLALYRDIAEADDALMLARILEESCDRFGMIPQSVGNLLCLAHLRQKVKNYGIQDIAVVGNNIKFTPLLLNDSGQIRLKRMFPAATYKATTHTVIIPIPRIAGMGSACIRDKELLQWIARTLASLHGQPCENETIGDFVEEFIASHSPTLPQ